VVSVLDWKFANNWAALRGFQHLHIPLDDVYDSNILSFFPRSNAFIHEGLKYSRSSQSTTSGAASKDDTGSGVTPLPGGVLVHWWVIPISFLISHLSSFNDRSVCLVHSAWYAQATLD
jgi:hypothetical protein